MYDRIKNVYNWFSYYIDHFSSSDKIELKKAHSLRCKDLGWDIAGRVSGMHVTGISAVVGLLHDIGRFKQVRDYNTFRDSESFDHAKLGVEIIKEGKILEQNFYSDDCEEIYEAIYLHNKMSISVDNYYAKMIRDIDKLDNYPIIVREFVGKNSNEFSDNVLEMVLQKKQVDYSLIKKEGDRCLAYLMWLYDINDKEVLKRIKDGGYINILYGYLPKKNKFIDIIKSLDSYILEKTKGEVWIDE